MDQVFSLASRYFVALLSALFLAGCFQLESEMKVQPSGAASVQAAFGVPLQFLMFMPRDERRRFCTPEQMREMEGITRDIEIQTERQVRGKRIFCIFKARADHVSKFIDAMRKGKQQEKDPRLREMPLPLRQNPDGTYSVVLDFNLLDKGKGAEKKDPLAAALLGDSLLSFSLSAPHIEDVQGGKVENGTVNFSVRLAELLLMQPKPVFRVRFWCRREGAWYDPFGWFSGRKTC